MEKAFVNGMIIKKPSENAPDFIIANVSFKTQEMTDWLNDNTKGDGWCNIIIKESKGGKYYAEKDTYEPKQKPVDDDISASIPF